MSTINGPANKDCPVIRGGGGGGRGQEKLSGHRACQKTNTKTARCGSLCVCALSLFVEMRVSFKYSLQN